MSQRRRNFNFKSYSCPYPACTKVLQNPSGLTQHINAKHRRFQNHTIPQRSPRPEAGTDLQEDLQGAFEDLGAHGQPPEPERTSEDSDDGCYINLVHPTINGQPCNQNGAFISMDASPPPRTSKSPHDWTPYENRLEFETAEFLFQDAQLSEAKIKRLLGVWASTLLLASNGDVNNSAPPFASAKEMYEVIDATPLGDAPWKSFTASYTGPRPNTDVPSWMTMKHEVWFRDPKVILKNLLENPDFKDEFDVAPYRQYTTSGSRRYQHFMSGDWAWNQCNLIAKDPTTHGAMFCPAIFGSDKTTVSVATGQNDYYPLYMTLANIFNNVRRAHRNAVVVVAFLAVPKAEKRHANDPQFRKFRKQLFHSSLARIMRSLRAGMLKPEIMRCPDGHFRRVIFGLGPYIADYPEQALVACIVQGWCPTCLQHRTELGNDIIEGVRCREHTAELLQNFDSATLWDDYGIDASIVPFTSHFPRADIHELMSGDILHQLIKGTFKDHLVTWVGEYLEKTHSKKVADEIMDEIDRRIAAVPPFSGLRHFYQGRNFKQWTGNDSKGLMKVYIPAIAGLVPPEMVKAISSYIEFCYFARLDVHTEDSLKQMEAVLARFHQFRDIFRATGVRPDGFDSLPRQHSLKHQTTHIRNFGTLNGLCTSIMESKHIKAVKEPWRRSSRYEALGQMLVTNQRLDKLAAAHIDFSARGMLEGSSISYVLAELEGRGNNNDNDTESEEGHGHNDNERDGDGRDEDVEDEDVEDRDGEDEDGEDKDEDEDEEKNDGAIEGNRDHVDAVVKLAASPVRKYPKTLAEIGAYISIPDLPDLVALYLYDQAHPDTPWESTDPFPQLPHIARRVHVLHSAGATFYAPSDPSRTGGMRREHIRATPTWRKGPSRYDCVFISANGEDGFRGLHVARVRLFFRFRVDNQTHECALVEWFSHYGNEPDEETGLWIVTPDFDADGSRTQSVIHTDCIVRGAHLIPVFGADHIPFNFPFSASLDSFRAYYVNRFIDYHAFETIY
ncbi:hypothetical protein QCA50_012547 [Cerrena zonata]|uniref:C2H2-type domain-containing protein n=1 Tax=Cerrena zonata TaxID=2478898 RepID=A0AAW0FT49_9APHY